VRDDDRGVAALAQQHEPALRLAGGGGDRSGVCRNEAAKVDVMIKPVYHRQSRTASSEQYQLMDGSVRLGHLDLHFGMSEVFGTLVLDRELSEDDVMQLIEQIDEDLVLSSEVAREDFLIRVYVGQEMGLYSDELMRDDFDAGDEEDLDGDT
jgi:hypothetical protein